MSERRGRPPARFSPSLADQTGERRSEGLKIVESERLSVQRSGKSKNEAQGSVEIDVVNLGPEEAAFVPRPPQSIGRKRKRQEQTAPAISPQPTPTDEECIDVAGTSLEEEQEDHDSSAENPPQLAPAEAIENSAAYDALRSILPGPTPSGIAAIHLLLESTQPEQTDYGDYYLTVIPRRLTEFYRKESVLNIVANYALETRELGWVNRTAPIIPPFSGEPGNYLFLVDGSKLPPSVLRQDALSPWSRNKDEIVNGVPKPHTRCKQRHFPVVMETGRYQIAAGERAQEAIYRLHEYTATHPHCARLKKRIYYLERDGTVFGNYMVLYEFTGTGGYPKLTKKMEHMLEMLRKGDELPLLACIPGQETRFAQMDTSEQLDIEEMIEVDGDIEGEVFIGEERRYASSGNYQPSLPDRSAYRKPDWSKEPFDDQALIEMEDGGRCVRAFTPAWAKEKVSLLKFLVNEPGSIHGLPIGRCIFSYEYLEDGPIPELDREFLAKKDRIDNMRVQHALFPDYLLKPDEIDREFEHEEVIIGNRGVEINPVAVGYRGLQAGTSAEAAQWAEEDFPGYGGETPLEFEHLAGYRLSKAGDICVRISDPANFLQRPTLLDHLVNDAQKLADIGLVQGRKPSMVPLTTQDGAFAFFFNSTAADRPGLYRDALSPWNSSPKESDESSSSTKTQRAALRKAGDRLVVAGSIRERCDTSAESYLWALPALPSGSTLANVEISEETPIYDLLDVVDTIQLMPNALFARVLDTRLLHDKRRILELAFNQAATVSELGLLNDKVPGMPPQTQMTGCFVCFVDTKSGALVDQRQLTIDALAPWSEGQRGAAIFIRPKYKRYQLYRSNENARRLELCWNAGEAAVEDNASEFSLVVYTATLPRCQRLKKRIYYVMCGRCLVGNAVIFYNYEVPGPLPTEMLKNDELAEKGEWKIEKRNPDQAGSSSEEQDKIVAPLNLVNAEVLDVLFRVLVQRNETHLLQNVRDEYGIEILTQEEPLDVAGENPK
ncbi:unnamed protein product, partial [Mesorhabditis spiculigera]